MGNYSFDAGTLIYTTAHINHFARYTSLDMDFDYYSLAHEIQALKTLVFHAKRHAENLLSVTFYYLELEKNVEVT